MDFGEVSFPLRVYSYSNVPFMPKISLWMDWMNNLKLGCLGSVCVCVLRLSSVGVYEMIKRKMNEDVDMA
jgi:hypothetical protein